MKNSIKFAGFLLILAVVAIDYFCFGGQVSMVSKAVVFGPMVFTASSNMGGYKSRLAYIPASYVTAVPLLPATITAVSDYVTASGAFTFKNTMKAVGIQATDKTVKYDGDSQGEQDGQSFGQKGEFFYPGDEAAVGALAIFMQSNPGYLIIENGAGKQFMIGQPGLFCNIKPGFKGGQKRTDLKGMTFAFESDCIAPFIILGTPIDINALFTV